MKSRLAVPLLLAVLLLSACTMWRQHPVHGWRDATGGAGLEQTFWKQVKDGKWNELRQHIASNYVAVTPEEGRFDREAFLAHLRRLHLEEYALGDIQTELNGETFVVTYAITMRGAFEGQPLPSGPVRMMTVWQKQKAGWMAIAHTVIGLEKSSSGP
jgi:hypothetical protein